jgi:hypothetical protein
MRPLSVEGDLTLVPQTTATHLECLVLDHMTSRERNVADLVAAHLGAAPDGFGDHRVGRVRITIEPLAESGRRPAARGRAMLAR